jgi:hypothetical protein
VAVHFLCGIRRCGSGYGMIGFDLRFGVVEILLQVGDVAEAAYDSPRSRLGSCGINTRPNKPVGINTTVTTNNIPSAKSQ